jgi:hypothetical protein
MLYNSSFSINSLHRDISGSLINAYRVIEKCAWRMR